MKIPEDLQVPFAKGLARAEYGDLTAAEMERYLADPRRRSTGFSPETAARTVALLREAGVLDDKRTLRAMVRSLDRRLLGPRRIREELRRRLFPAAYVEAAMNREVDFAARAYDLLLKTPRAAETAQTPEGRKKLAARLVRAGFEPALAFGAVKRLCAGADDSFFEEENLN